ncbi:hypothetical protein CmeUKMEL1_02940 [Cryptosporidium meleagridis]|uniref:Integral membrane protein n=1 Tax=Cryptosporidium meleagridis TaxID=93969 RepID=A0A2P4YXK4_9CRYT|nr:hypothetical protein CmeUKMEL1_02940 [Cryptosporidium meleagridis]
MLKSSSTINFLLVLLFTVNFTSNNFVKNFVLEVSFLNAASLETGIESEPLALPQQDPQTPQFGVLQGKGETALGNFMTSNGVGLDLSVSKSCSKNELKKLLKLLENTMITLFEIYGKSVSLEKPINEQSVSSAQEVNKINDLKAKTISLNEKLEQLLKEIFSCVLRLTAKKYSGRSIRTNKKGCTILSVVYFSALKSASEMTLSALKKVLKELSKLYNKCLSSIHLDPVSCRCYGYSLSSAQDSFSLQKQISKDSTAEKMKCKRYVRSKISTRLFGGVRARKSGETVYEDENEVETYL